MDEEVRREGEQGESPVAEVSLEAKRRGTVRAYEVAGRMLLQGALAGVAGGVPLTAFLVVGMALDGVAPPGPASILGAYLFFAVMLAAWGGALTAVEEFARRAGRSISRMIAASLGFPLFATLVAAWIGGVIQGGPRGGLTTVRLMLGNLAGEFRREPVASLAIAAAFLVPFLGLLLLRRHEREQEGELLVSRYYLGSGALGVATAGCISVANVFWRTRMEPGPVLVGFVATACLLVAVAWGLARGRSISDRYAQRYEAWADAD